MKKVDKAVTGILVVILIALAGFSVYIIKETASVRKTAAKLEKEVMQMESEAEDQEKGGKQLQEEIAFAKGKLEESRNADHSEEVPQNEAAPVSANGKKVAIDPGHQGYHVDMSDLEPMGPGSQEMKAKATSGTQGRFTGVPEYELTLAVSMQLRQELETRGYEVLLTRQDNDTAVSNSERALLAADFGADIYVRIHANGSEDSGANGALAMVPSMENPYVSHLHEKSYALGEHVINAYCQSCGLANLGVQLSDNMTGINWSQMPVMILEMGFMTNESDDVNMQNADFQVLMVQGIANGIDQYFAAGN